MATIWVSERPVERVHFSLTLYGASGDLCRRYRQHSVSAIDELTSTGERAHRSDLLFSSRISAQRIAASVLR